MRDGALLNCALRFIVASASARRLPVRMPLRAFSGPFACWPPGTVRLQNSGQRDKKNRAERKRDRHRRASAFEERKRSACKRQCRRSGACRPGLSWAMGADAPPFGGGDPSPAVPPRSSGAVTLWAHCAEHTAAGLAPPEVAREARKRTGELSRGASSESRCMAAHGHQSSSHAAAPARIPPGAWNVEIAGEMAHRAESSKCPEKAGTKRCRLQPERTAGAAGG